MTRFQIAVAILLAIVMPATIILMAALSELTRWSGYTEVLPLTTLLLLFVVGNFIVTSATRRR